MSRAKPNRVRPDGRSSNGKKKGEVSRKERKMTLSQLNKAKKERLNLYAINAIKEQFGSEESFFEHLAKESKSSFNHFKMMMEYAYGKPEDFNHRAPSGNNAPTIVFVNNSGDSDKTIDIQHEEDED